jgi:hypothetical protein
MDHPEWHCTKGYLERSVVAVFHPRQPAQPAPWLVPRKAMKVDSQDHIRHLCLTVSLRVECSACS